MTNDTYRTSRQPKPVEAEIIENNAIVPADVLPRNSLNENLRSGYSLRGVMERSRLKAELSREAFVIYRQGVVTAMAQEMDLVLYAKGLRTAASKNAFLARHIEENKALAKALHEQVVSYIEQMTDQQVDYVMDAEMQAQKQMENVRQKIEAGALPEKSADNMVSFIERQRSEKIRRILDYSDRDLDKLSEMVALAQSTVLKSLEVHGR